MDTQKYLQTVAKENLATDRPDVKTGFTVRVHQKIVEGNKTRVQMFEGLVIAVNGQGPTKTITVRKIASGVGVERIFVTASPSIEKIEVIKVAKVRRSKLYYMRQRSGKSARLKERRVSLKEFANTEKEEA
ncbi:MAG: 50S ribosomal protein L19 [Patescibacteria group bacterium]|nr:50S ribosomal protein L19 [Patescibacteria group bacterium]